MTAAEAFHRLDDALIAALFPAPVQYASAADVIRDRHRIAIRSCRSNRLAGDLAWAANDLEFASWCRADLAEAKAQNNTNQHDGE